ncbi:uncharacterized protein N7503_004534 [Penicillium pulvis]|uniref:uncharacterized protein n=1 Tax=Penicillium pulvis TaxID=1562058 RepID=UPI0025483186|nr:uncharacterized protein N7503_004534 [Penicillium pulvis]KAJ5802084.1 hypothetical protein N7503_004534 [Penicillium pulvis]
MPLIELPTELLNEICGYLNEYQLLCAIRLTCKALFLASPRDFTDRYCKSIHLLLSTESLHQLGFIAADDYRRTLVNELCLVTTDLEGYGELAYCDFCRSPFRHINPSQRSQRTVTEDDIHERHTAYQTIISDRDTVIETDFLEKTLVKSMTRFVNLTAVGLRDMTMHELFRPKLARKSQCLGIRKFSDALPCDLIMVPPVSRLRTDVSPLSKNRGLVFSHILNALTQCDGLKIQKLSTSRVGLTPEHLVMTESQYAGLTPHLRSLTHIQLRLLGVRLHSEGARSQFETLLSFLVAVAPELRVLDFSQAAQEQSTKSLRMNTEVFSQQFSCISFLKLEMLHLYDFDITTNALIAFVRTAMPTLKTLTLRSVSLNDEMPSIPQDENLISKDIIWSAESKEAIQGLWQQVFDFFRDQLGLRYLKMECLKYRHHEIQMKDPSTRRAHMSRMACFGKGLSPLGTPRAPRAPLPALNGASDDDLESQISFRAWIDQLQIIPESWHDTHGERISNGIEL